MNQYSSKVKDGFKCKDHLKIIADYLKIWDHLIQNNGASRKSYGSQNMQTVIDNKLADLLNKLRDHLTTLKGHLLQ